MTISNPGPDRHTDEPDPSNSKVHPLLSLIVAMIAVFVTCCAIYLAFPVAKFWVEIGGAAIAPIVAEVVRQINDQRGRHRGT
ncbi:hypothetical protein QN239_24185 [Mycolicibacterium sp. Y3]